MKSPLGASERHPTGVADGALHVYESVHESADRHDDGREHRHAGGELPAWPGAAVLNRSAGGSNSEPRSHFQEYFIQDDWRVSDRLTVNAGLRYTLNFPSFEEHDQVAIFNLE